MSMPMYTIRETERKNEYLIDKDILESIHEDRGLQTKVIQRYRVFVDRHNSVGTRISFLREDLRDFIREKGLRGPMNFTTGYRVFWKPIESSRYSDAGTRYATLTGALKHQQELIVAADHVNLSIKK